MYIQSNLKHLMKKNKLNQEQLAQRLGLSSYSTIGKYLNGKNIPSVEILIKMRELFEVTIDDLLLKDFSKD